jgi:hypothetical protein
MVAWSIQAAASEVLGAGGAVVIAAWDGGAAAVVVGTLRGEGVGLAAAGVPVVPVVPAGTAATAEVVGAADGLVLGEALNRGGAGAAAGREAVD